MGHMKEQITLIEAAHAALAATITEPASCDDTEAIDDFWVVVNKVWI